MERWVVVSCQVGTLECQTTLTTTKNFTKKSFLLKKIQISNKVWFGDFDFIRKPDIKFLQFKKLLKKLIALKMKMNSGISCGMATRRTKKNPANNARSGGFSGSGVPIGTNWGVSVPVCEEF